jgi:hypothetical protein
MITWGIGQILNHAEVSLGGLNRRVPEGKLNLFKRGASSMREFLRTCDAYAECGINAAMPNPGLCRIDLKGRAPGVELTHQAIRLIRHISETVSESL